MEVITQQQGKYIYITPPELHPAQMEVHKSTARHRMLVAGRRWGKTRLGAIESFLAMCSGKRVWWVAPTYIVSRVAWRVIHNMCYQLPYGTVYVRRADRSITMLPTGGEISVRSADRPQLLRSEGLDLLIVDEAAYVPREAWTESLRPMLLDRMGRALLISTPRKITPRYRPWLYDYMSEVADNPDWAIYSYPSHTNPYIPPEELERLRSEMSDIVYRQEILAEWVEVAQLVLPEYIIHGEPPEDAQYVMGVDLAISTRESADYTALVVMARDSEGVLYIVDAIRGHWTFREQVDNIILMARRYNISVLSIEAVQYQAAIVQELARTTELPVRPVRPDRDKLTRFLPLLTRLEQRLVRFSASLPLYVREEYLDFPSSDHDDIVDACVYAFSSFAPNVDYNVIYV